MKKNTPIFYLIFRHLRKLFRPLYKFFNYLASEFAMKMIEILKNIA